MLGREDKISPTKLNLIQYATAVVFLGLAFGLWRLQVFESSRYGSLAEHNRIREVEILAPRGKIVDREGRVIVDNYPSFSALFIRNQAKDLQEDLPKIAAGLNIEPEQIRERLRKLGNASQVVLKDDITPADLAFIESHRNELPELDHQMVHRRLYPRNGFAAHLIGYVGEVSDEMLKQPQYEFYKSGDVVGRSGIEQYYNELLMGKNGKRRSVVNSRGKEVASTPVPEEPLVPGKQLRLTIDLDMQIAAEQALEGKYGAIVAIDPRNGEVLAMVSRPAFDPNEFAIHITREQWKNLVTDDAKPLLNKAIQAQLAPGSVFKIIMAVAGLQEGIARTLHVNCGGGKTFYGRFFRCWIAARHGSHGDVGINKAIYQSCDSFFYTLGERLGIGKIAQYAAALGMGQKTGIDLPQEASGVMPSEQWKIRTAHEKWYAGETISVSIGQGAVATTPIQLARAIGGIASGGVLRRPHVVMSEDLPARYRDSSGVPEEVTIPLDPANWDIITNGMAGVVSPMGTAAVAKLPGIDWAGKTGSAQVISNNLRKKLTSSKFKDNGWFVGVSPHRNPEIAVCVLVEQGEHGSLAAELASHVVKAYVQKYHPIAKGGESLVSSDTAPAQAGIKKLVSFTPGHPRQKSNDSAAKHGTPVAVAVKDR